MLCASCENESYEVSDVYRSSTAYRIYLGTYLCNLCYQPRITKVKLDFQTLREFRKLEFLIKTLTTNMDHPFTPSASDLVHCRICKRAYKAHTDNVECESCDFIGKCNVYKNMLLCDNCIAKDKEASKAEVKATEELVETSKDLIDRANKIQNDIKYSGDFFNAETVAFNDVLKAYLTDASLPENEREFAFHRYLVETIENNQKKIFDNNTENLSLTVQNSAAINMLRNYGDKVREEHRERIKQSDAMYSPLNVKPVVVKVKKLTPANAIERIIDQLASQLNVSRDVARAMVEKGMTATRMGEDKISKEGV